MRFVQGHHLRLAEYKVALYTPERNAKISDAHADGRIPDPKPKPGSANPQWRGDEVGYAGAHQRLYNERGSPIEYECETCGDRAKEWALNHGLATKKDKRGGRWVPYSPDPQAYVPLCVSCHRSADRNGGYRA